MIRKANIKDAENIKKAINAFATQGQMLPVSINEVYEKIFEYLVYEEAGEVVGVCALHPTWSDIAEIRSLAVNSANQRRGIGGSLVKAQLARAKEFEFIKVFTLTYQVKFFKNLGFTVIELENLPKKIWTDCLKCSKFPDCDETAMEILL